MQNTLGSSELQLGNNFLYVEEHFHPHEMYITQDDLYTWQLQIFANTATCIFIAPMHLSSNQYWAITLHKSSTGSDCNISAFFIMDCTQIWGCSPQTVQFPFSNSSCTQAASFYIHKLNIDLFHAQQLDPASVQKQYGQEVQAKRYPCIELEGC